jgi:hypothetical protein
MRRRRRRRRIRQEVLMWHIPRWLALGIVALNPAGGPMRAQSRPSALAKAWQNPIGSVIDFPFDNSFGFGQDTGQRSIYTLDMRSVVPIQLRDGMRIVPRLVFPIQEVPFTNGSHFDLGDTRLEVLYAGGATSAQDGYALGIGPSFGFPTATNGALSSGKWEAGLAFTQVVSEGPWVVGAQLTQRWSYAGPASRRATAPFIGEPFVYYNFEEGWSLLSAPEIQADWLAAPNDGWTLPLGGGLAKTFGDHTQGFTASVAAYANTKRAAGAATWTLHARLSLLYPR